MTETTAAARTGRDLVAATRPFAVELRAKSWWALGSTLGLLALVCAVCTAPVWWPLRLGASLVAGLLIVRAFILYHDFLHGGILRGSLVARAVLYTFGSAILTPPRVWRQTHNYHHAHTAKIVGSHVGSFAMVTTVMWSKMKGRERLMYRIIRNPLTIVFAWVTIFAWGMCISSFLNRPVRCWDSLFAFVFHVGIGAAAWMFGGPEVFLFAFAIPMWFAFMMGAYLFYLQHNFEGVHIQPRHEWSYTRAALESSSFMKVGPVMHWFTGNIGYHHVHHLNPTIPFYRLPEAMALIPELQNPLVFTLRPRSIWASFRLKLWDAEQQQMVGYP